MGLCQSRRSQKFFDSIDDRWAQSRSSARLSKQQSGFECLDGARPLDARGWENTIEKCQKNPRHLDCGSPSKSGGGFEDGRAGPTARPTIINSVEAIRSIKLSISAVQAPTSVYSSLGSDPTKDVCAYGIDCRTDSRALQPYGPSRQAIRNLGSPIGRPHLPKARIRRSSRFAAISQANWTGETSGASSSRSFPANADG